MQTNHTKTVGLDIGQTSAKVVCMVRKGHDVQLTRAEIFRSRDEGILGDDETEQLSAIGGWLKELKLLERRVVLGLPQYMATTQVSDFAKGVRGTRLSAMVALETTQLSGISDDRFLHDYAVMPAGNGRQNPVLIGICRAANVDDYAGRAVDVSIQLEDVAMNALAMVNAFIHLKPVEASSQGIQVLMDLGTETTTLAIVCAGQLLYIGSMMFGGQNITQELAKRLSISLEEAERRKLVGEIDWAELAMEAMEQEASEDAVRSHGARQSEGEGGNSFLPDVGVGADEMVLMENADEAEPVKLGLKLKAPRLGGLKDEASQGGYAGVDSAGDDSAGVAIEDVGSADGVLVGSSSFGYESRQSVSVLDCFEVLLREIHNCLEHWRSSENEELVTRRVEHVWLCGGSATLSALQTSIAVDLGCDVDLVGPVIDGDGGAPSVDYTIAYGLALQGLGEAALPISLAPEALAWIHRKERRFEYVAVSLLIVVVFLLGWFGMEYLRVKDGIAKMEAQTSELKSNVVALQKLDGMKREYCGVLMQALPVVSSLSRTQVYLDVLERLQEAVRSNSDKESVSWCVYVADGDSFLELNESQEAKAAAILPASGGGGRRQRRTLLMETVETPESKAATGWQKVLEEESKVRDTVEVKALRRFYVVGIIMSKKDNHNAIERDLILHLKNQASKSGKGSFFSDVQVMSEEELRRCANRALLDWEKCFANLRTNEAFKSYDNKPFFWRLELTDGVVTPPQSNPLYVARKAKRKK